MLGADNATSHRDYILEEYKRNGVVDQTAADDKPSSNLFEEFCLMIGNSKILARSKSIQDHFGLNKTVVGVKLTSIGYSFEFYYYYPNVNPKHGFGSVLSFNGLPSFNIPDSSYLNSFSLDKDANRISTNVYYTADHCLSLGHTRESIYNGYSICRSCLETESFSYNLQTGLLSRENLYKFFYVAYDGYDRAYRYLDTLRGEDTSNQIFKVICRKSVCVTTKPDSIGIYYSHLDIDELIRFITFFEYYPQFIDFIIANREFYSHLLFDVGYNFTVRDGKPVYTKSSVYFLI